jgi:threonine/homoserine/homoserine lactone efflux protein
MPLPRELAPTLLRGLIFGFSIAAPVGPIGLLCIRRSLVNGRTSGFISGLGAASADAFYGLIAALGLTAITRLLLDFRGWLQFGGGLFLVYLGVATLRASPKKPEPLAPKAESETAAAENSLPASPATEIPKATLRSDYLSALALTLTNPMTILSFIAIFAGLGIVAETGGGNFLRGCTLVLGIFLGSTAWWLILSTAAAWLGLRLHRGGLRILNIASGLMIAGFGVWNLVRLARGL